MGIGSMRRWVNGIEWRMDVRDWEYGELMYGNWEYGDRQYGP